MIMFFAHSGGERLGTINIPKVKRVVDNIFGISIISLYVVIKVIKSIVWFLNILSTLLNQLSYQTRPASLMIRAYSRTVITVKILVKKN